MDKITIGIDTGVNTGFAMFVNKNLKEIRTCMLHQALLQVAEIDLQGLPLMVYVEDARMATQYRHDEKNQAKLQGAGSVKRDAKVWEEFLKDYSIPYKMVRPNKTLNLMAEKTSNFKRKFNWHGRTSHHARVAAYIAHSYI